MKVTGNIFNYLKKPIVGAVGVIQNSYPEIITTTDSNGYFEIEVTGKQVIVFKHKNTKQELAVGVSEKETTPLVLTMMNELESTQTESCKKSKLFPVLIFTAGLLTGVLFSGKEKHTVKEKI